MISRFNLVATTDLVLSLTDDAARNDKRCGRVASWPARWWRQVGIPAVAGRSGEPAAGVAGPRHQRAIRRHLRSSTRRSSATCRIRASPLALSESELPGGHSPAYFAILNQPLPTTPYVWRNDPVSFNSYPTFFLAHELGHQWWGQAIGWKNYHEQWLSEGIAQYFAAMYAEKERGNETFVDVLRQMRRWAIEASPQGPVYLGYRLGHVKGDSRVFRAVIYNKAAMVMHMLRRLIGDDAFFRGIRAFYAEWQFRKAGTDDLRVAMEKASGRT